ncbi:hypothetical protein [Alkanindiges illinoisensis]|uniref:Uncharacterized protein n=1 Tax=Alkanindiges illinoisensis TaxID=197183 RepID=A0A4Y7XA51_9GAMM|nr:hypothetical protein [Alkanindiges illinoisensis]TEU24180.1 hypothetical protein E2B99_12240 [Alkanindiges illinoisensis]
MKKIKFIRWMLVALILTYLSLLVPAQAQVVRPEIMGCEQGCPVVAAGFPMPFLVDGVISPVGSVSINPLVVLFVHLDEFVPSSFAVSYLFWLALTLIAVKLYRIQHP